MRALFLHCASQRKALCYLAISRLVRLAIFLRVREYEVTLNGKPVVYVKLGSNEEGSYMLAVLKESVQKGYQVDIQGSSSLSVNID